MDAQYVGHRVLLETNNSQRITGFIQSINKSNQRITLHGVTDLETGKSLQGLHHFFRDEIKEVEIQLERKEVLRVKGGDNTLRSHGRSIQHRKQTPRHLATLRDLNHTHLLLSKQITGSKGDAADGDSGAEDGENFSLPEDCTLLNDCNSQIFKDAIAYLEKQTLLAVSFEGVRLGRSGKLCWILMASREHIMFFDVLTMGKACMEAGLKQILESGTILKVIHDCRQPSDIMHHQYGVQLRNIFDTQVAVVMVFRLEHGNSSLPRYVAGLGECLQKQLQLSPEEVHIMLVREEHPEKDEKVWELRPSNSQVLEAAYKHVVHLLNLRQVLMEKMQTEFILGVDIYIKKVRDANDARAKTLQQKQHLLPQDFVELPKMVQATFTEQALQRPRIPLKYVEGPKVDKHGLRENCSGVVHPFVIASHDTIWHGSGRKSLPKQQSGWQKSSITKMDSREESRPLKNGVDSNARHLSDNESVSTEAPATDSVETPAGSTRFSHIARVHKPTFKTNSIVHTATGIVNDTDGCMHKEINEIEACSESDGGKKSVQAFLREFMESQANGENEMDSLTSHFTVRPAGSEMFSDKDGKWKVKKKAVAGTVDMPYITSDLADDSKQGPRFQKALAGTAEENSFDLIPSKTFLTHKPGGNGVNTSTIIHPTKKPTPADSGFSPCVHAVNGTVDSTRGYIHNGVKPSMFSEVHRAPVPNAGDDASGRTASAALADILPSLPADAKSSMSEGIRLWTRGNKQDSLAQQPHNGQRLQTLVTGPQDVRSLQQLISFNAAHRDSSKMATESAVTSPVSTVTSSVPAVTSPVSAVTSSRPTVISPQSAAPSPVSTVISPESPVVCAEAPLIPDLVGVTRSGDASADKCVKSGVTFSIRSSRSLLQQLGLATSPQEQLMKVVQGSA